ncbi:MAG: T9SS type A sorting domain-containing protein [Bacteroidales bacterium]
MKRLITIVLILFSLITSGQNWQWVKQFTQSPNPNLSNELDIYDVKLSATGNIYITGSYISNFTLSGTTYNGYPSSASEAQDIFLAKLDSDGNVLWVQTAGSSDVDYPETLVLDGSENVYLSGRTKGTCDFGSGYSITTSGGFDGFVAKYNSLGAIQWVKKVAYGTNNDRVTAITLGTDGNLYLAGLFKSASVTIGDGTTGTNFTNADNVQDLYLASLTSSGIFRWAKQIPITGTNEADNPIFKSIVCDNYNYIYVGGGLLDKATIDGADYTSTGKGDIILIKANTADGSAEWVRKGGSTSDDQLNSVAIYDDFTYLIGYIQGTGTIDSTGTQQSSQFFNTGAAGTNDIFLAKYNLDGRLLWKKTIGSTGADVGYGLNILNNILVATGYFSNTINFNLRTITSGGGYDAAYFVFDVESNAVSANSVSGTLEDRGQGVCLDNDYNIYLGGYFMSPTLTAGTNTLTNSATSFKDLFIGKYHRDFSATFTSKKNVGCNGGDDGELTVTPYFGIPPYTYTWLKDSNPFAATDSALTGLSAGTYQVTVTDGNSNSVILSYSVTQPSLLTITSSKTNVTCYGQNDGSINITVAGGITPYTYFWTTSDGYGHDIDSEDQTGLSSGTYTVEVTDGNGCSTSGNITVTQPAKISIPGTVTNISGAGSNGAVDITVTGGSGTYSSYSWTLSGSEVATAEDISGLNVGGDYTIVVTDNTACKDSNSFDVLDERVFHGWISSQSDISCKDDSSGSATVSYAENTGTVAILWSTGETTFTISGKTAGTYNVDLTDDMGTPGDTGDDQTINVEVTLTQPAAVLQGSIISTPTTCHGGTDGILDLTPSGGTGPYTYQWDTTPVEITQDINNLPVGSYQVTITDSKGCTTLIPGVVSQPDDITFSFNSTQPTCYGGYDGSLSVTGLTGGTPSYSYLWSNTLTSVSINNLKVGNYWLKVNDSNGCTKTQSVYLSQPTDITISHVENKPTCPESKDGSIGLTVSGGTGTKTYFWTGPDIVNATGKDQINLGVGNYEVIVTDANGCTKNYQVILTEENSSPTAGIFSSESDNAICIGDNIIFTATGGNTYEFFLNGSSVQASSTDATYNSTSLVDGDQVHAIVTSSSGCSATSSTITTTVNPLPAVVANANQTVICEGDPVTLTGSGASSYSWDQGVNNGEEFYPSSTQTYTVTGTDANGCINTDQIQVTVNPVPVASVNTTDPLSYCDGDVINTAFSATPADATAYQWLRNGSNISGALYTTYTATQDGLYSVWVSKNGCWTISDDVEIVVNPLPSVSLSDFSPVCIDASPITLDGGLPGGGTYSGGGVTGGTFDPATAGAGTHAVTYSYTDANGCSSAASGDIVVNALPAVSLADLSPVCIDASPITLDGGLPGGGTYSGGGVTGGTFDPATAGAGTHAVTYSYTDANGCSNYVGKDIVVNDLPDATISTTDPTVWCADASVSVNLNVAVADSYQWILNGLDIDGANSHNYVATEAGDYSVRVTSNGCSATGYQVTVSVIDPTVSVSTAQSTTWCSNDEVSVLLEANPSDAESYQWLKDGVTIDGATLSNYTSSEPGTYTVLVIFAGGCNITSEGITLTENPSPVVDIATDTVRINTQSDYTLDAGAGFTSYLWSDNSTAQTLYVDGAMLGEGVFKYWVDVTNEYSCAASDTAVVKVKLWDNVDTDNGWTISLYPNPTSGEFKLYVSGLKNGEYLFSIYSSTGNLILSKTQVIQSGEIMESFNIDKFSKGLYYLRFGKDNHWITRKVILK